MPTILRGGRRRVHRALGLLAALAPALLPALLLTACGGEPSAEPSRSTVLSLDGTWSLTLDPGAVGLEAGWAADLSAGRVPETASMAAFPIEVPGPLEGAPQTALYDLGAARGYDGTVWYQRRFVAPDPLPGGVQTARARLRFERVNYAARVWLDGREVGQHEGGYAPFTLDLTGRLRPGAGHSLVVMVVDPGDERVHGWTLKETPHAKESWYHNWGGLLGSVTLALHGDPVIEDLSLRTERATGEVVAAFTLLTPPGFSRDRVTVDLGVVGDERKTLEVPVETAGAHAADGVERRLTDVRLALRQPRRWTPDEPVLHRFTTRVDGRAGPALDFGFPSLELRDGDLYVAGERRVLKGVLFQPHFTGTYGMPPDPAFLEDEVRAMLDTGLDFVRVHVAPAPEAFLDACDRLGLMVIEEPAIGWVEDSPELPDRLRAEIDWMVARDARHPSIVMWGVLNELSGRAFHHADALVAALAARDPDRPVLEDSGGFHGGGRVRLPGASGTRPMVDHHAYPPYPLPLDRREELRALSSPDGGPVFVSEYGYGTLIDTGAAVAGFAERGLHGEEAALFLTLDGRRRQVLDSGAAPAVFADPFAAAAPQGAETSGEEDEDRDEGVGEEDGWVARAAGRQADAAEDLTEALRANPELDLLCYTQWRAVSTEASAGLLDVWGENRPARAHLARAIRPLMTAVFPERHSCAPGATLRVEVVVVNDTGRDVEGTLELVPAHVAAGVEDVAEPYGRWDGPFAPGVTSFAAGIPIPAETAAPSLALAARILKGREGPWRGPAPLPLDVSTGRRVELVAPFPREVFEVEGGAPLSALAVADAAAGRAHLQRQGWTLAGPLGRAIIDGPPPPDVLLVTDGEDFATAPLDQRLEAWHFVRQGGAAVVLLPDPAARPLDVAFGPRRVARVPAGLPVATVMSSAPGNFQGRIHLAHAHGGRIPYAPPEVGLQADPWRVWRALGRGDEPLSPRTLLAGEPRGASRAAMITLGHAGAPVGSPWVVLPYGAGELVCIGLPLLDPAGGDGDADADVEVRRDLVLSSALLWAAQRSRARMGGHAPPRPRGDEAAEAALARDLARLEARLDLASRFGPLAGAAVGLQRLPAPLQGAALGREAMLAAWLDGDSGRAAELARASLEAARLPVGEELLDREGAVAADLGRALGAMEGVRGPAAGRAYDALEDWARAVQAIFAGEPDEAAALLDRASSHLAGLADEG